ncbi:6,7-dimethyl-8-ribityllumazine synthase [Candidatus Woesearchaeota archaeon]|nr:6,7-dimethyl-8-ribityllumazine synthase [Candidatus Woesearchaeota archaeon]
MKHKIGIVVSQMHKEITDKMLELAELTAKNLDVKVQKVIKVPGSFDIPLAARMMLEKEDVDGIVTLGVIIKGETGHDELIAYTVAEKLSELSLLYNKPVVLGINGPKMTPEQAVVRIKRAKQVTEACVSLIKTLNSSAKII